MTTDTVWSVKLFFCDKETDLLTKTKRRFESRWMLFSQGRGKFFFLKNNFAGLSDEIGINCLVFLCRSLSVRLVCIRALRQGDEGVCVR